LLADIRLCRFDRLLLLIGQAQRAGNFRITESPRSALLKGDLFEARQLFFREHFGHCLSLGLLHFGELRAPLLGTQVAQAAERFALVFQRGRQLFDLLCRQL
jgi:hypothetical protein